MQKMCWVTVTLFFLSLSTVIAQKVSFSGTVAERETGNPMIGVNVYLKGTTLGTITNVDGKFRLKNIKPGEYEVVISSMGYHRITESITLDKDVSDKHYLMDVSISSMGEVVVTGTATPHHLKSAPVQTELISKKLIKQIAPTSFTDLMSNISPSFDFSPAVMGGFMQLNGLSNDYILVLIDGKRIYGDISGQNDLNRINPDNIERIEVVKGASSALYGSEAIAGVINVITKKSSKNVHVTNSTKLGEYGEWNQHNDINLNFGRLSSTTSFDRKQTDGWQLSPYELDGNDLVETDAMAINPSTDFTLKQHLSYSLAQNLSIYVQGSKYERNMERPQSVSSYGFLYDDFTYSAGAKYLLNKTNYVQADWHSDDFNYFYIYNQDDDDYTSGDKEKQTEQLRNALNIKSVFRVQEKQLFTLGGEYVNEEMESEGRLIDERASAYTMALYAQDEIKIIDDLSIVAGLRYVNHKEFGNAVTPKISALYTIKDFNIRGTYSRGFKTPTMKELYYYYERRGTLYLGNPDLKPQTSDYYATSLEYIKQGYSFSLTAYQNDVNDLVNYQSVETSEEEAANGITSTRQQHNIAEARTKGIDFIFNLKLPYGFSTGGGYSYVDARNLTDSIRLEYVAQNHANVRIGYQHFWKKYGLSANLVGQIQDEKFHEDGNAKGFNIWKFTTTHRFDTKGAFDIEATAGIDNVFDYIDDSPYGSHYGTINPGRTFFVGLNVEFSY